MEKDILEKIVKESKTTNEVFTRLGKNNSSNNYKLFRKLIKEYEIDISHFLTKSENIKEMFKNGQLKICKLENIFCENSKVSRNTAKNRIIKDNLIKYECCFCGNEGVWMGKNISLILDHMNGVNNDNRIDNLRFVCPNCNSTLDTHCKGSKGLIKKIEKIDGRKTSIHSSRIDKRKVERPDIEELKKQISEIGYSATGRIYGVSDNAIRKWLK